MSRDAAFSLLRTVFDALEPATSGFFFCTACIPQAPGSRSTKAHSVATGIEEVLKAAGKKWYALSPGWRDKRKQHVDFFLNPCEQERYDFGWFTVEELRQWARDEGPVLLDKTLRDFQRTQEGFELMQQVQNQLKQHGIRTRNNSKLVWMDADKTVKGIFLHVYYEDEDKLSDGTYAIDELLARFPVKAAEVVQG